VVRGKLKGENNPEEPRGRGEKRTKKAKGTIRPEKKARTNGEKFGGESVILKNEEW